jgi:hypothetical protein
LKNDAKLKLKFKTPNTTILFKNSLYFFSHIRVIRKVRKRQHQYPEFRHKQGENEKKPCKASTLERKTGWNWENHPVLVVFSVSPCLSFFLSASTSATYIFTAPTSTATIIPLQSCAWNAEFHYFILSFNEISLLYWYHWKRG